jgi:hypothetical protein
MVWQAKRIALVAGVGPWAYTSPKTDGETAPTVQALSVVRKSRRVVIMIRLLVRLSCRFASGDLIRGGK